MTNRWGILALLFAARTIMAMQFQAVGALSPALMARHGVGLTEIGIAIGFYFAPGLALALPGGAITARFGERLVSGVALGLMAAGGAVMALTEHWGVFLVAQCVAGAGGVIVNVSMTKMVADWFQGRDLATALSLFINSWPVGIALSLVLLPPLAASSGTGAALGVIALAAAVMGCLVPWLYRPQGRGSAAAKGRWPDRHNLNLALYSGLVWGAFNAGIAVVFGFGTALLSEAGLAPDAAARRVSLVLWSLAIVTPAGGWLADRLRHPEVMIGSGLAALAVFTFAAAFLQGPWPLLVLIGAAAGLVAGPVMSLPARALAPEARAVGMGIFFTVYYVAFLTVPPIAGWTADQQESLLAAFVIGCSMYLVAILGLIVFAASTRRIRE